PLVNPSFPKAQVMGVYNLEIARAYNYLFQQTDKRFTILHSLDGYDEVSLTADTRLINNQGEHNLTPEELGKTPVKQEDLYGGNTIQKARDMFQKIIKGEGTQAQSSVITANADVGIKCAGLYDSYEDCYQAAKESPESGKAYKVLTDLIELP